MQTPGFPPCSGSTDAHHHVKVVCNRWASIGAFPKVSRGPTGIVLGTVSAYPNSVDRCLCACPYVCRMMRACIFCFCARAHLRHLSLDNACATRNAHATQTVATKKQRKIHWPVTWQPLARAAHSLMRPPLFLTSSNMRLRMSPTAFVTMDLGNMRAVRRSRRRYAVSDSRKLPGNDCS